MISEKDTVLYIGKAKNLRARLNSYKRAKPDTVSRKVVRMLKLVRVIRWEICKTEKAALLRENELLRQYRPPFNIVNTRPESYYFIGLKFIGSQLQFRLTTKSVECDDSLYGTFKGRHRVRLGYSALLRLLWAAHSKTFSLTNTSRGLFQFPALLMRPKPPYVYSISLAPEMPDHEARNWTDAVVSFLTGENARLMEMLALRLLQNLAIPPFMYSYIQENFEELQDFYEMGPARNARLRKFIPEAKNPPRHLIAQDEIDDLLVLQMMAKPRD
jgi:excinuclease ABC subunit C